MNKEIKERQNKIVDSLIERLETQNKTGDKANIITSYCIVSVEEMLNSVYKMTKRKDLKEKIEKALPNINN